MLLAQPFRARNSHRQSKEILNDYRSRWRSLCFCGKLVCSGELYIHTLEFGVQERLTPKSSNPRCASIFRDID